VDAAAGLPGLSARRGVAVYRAANPELSERAGSLAVRFQTLMERDDRAGAQRALEEAVEQAPRAVGLLVILAQIKEQAGDDQAAIEPYLRALTLQPTNVVALNNLAYALAVRHNPAQEA